MRKKLGLPSPFDMRFSNPLDLHGVALQFPQVNFVVPHFGAGYFRETLMLGDLCLNVHVDTSSSNSWVRYAAGVRDLEEVFTRALEVFGPRRILFGSDSSAVAQFEDGRRETEFGLGSDGADDHPLRLYLAIMLSAI